jgi:hypothetical protein
MGHWNPLFFRFATSYVSSLGLIKLSPALPNQSKPLARSASRGKYLVAPYVPTQLAIHSQFDSDLLLLVSFKEWSDGPLLRALRDHSFTVGPQRAQGLSGRSAPALASPSSAPVQCCFIQPNSLAFQLFKQLEEGR